MKPAAHLQVGGVPTTLFEAEHAKQFVEVVKQ